MRLRRRKQTRANQLADVLTAYLKLQAAKKAARGARKAAKGTAAYQVAKRTPVVRKVPLIAGAGAGIVAIVAARKLRGGDESATANA